MCRVINPRIAEIPLEVAIPFLDTVSTKAVSQSTCASPLGLHSPKLRSPLVITPGYFSRSTPLHSIKLSDHAISLALESGDKKVFFFVNSRIWCQMFEI